MPRELRLELPRHIATRPRRRRSNRPHTGNHTHTCADAVRTGHSLSTHTIREHSRAREEEGGSREIAHDSDDGVEQAARSCEPTATRAFGVSVIWLDRTFCYPCCPPLLTLKDNLHSRCAAISDYPSRPSSPADRWLYLLIGPLNLLGWRAPRAASGAPEAHRHTTPASALKQAHRAGCRSGESQVVS